MTSTDQSTDSTPWRSECAILLVDDDVELCQLMTELLRKHGHRVDCAYNGRDGLEQALQQRHDLVILDGMLPVLDGFEVLRRLRKRSAVPVIMLTARTEQRDRVTGLDSGADDYVSKPFGPDELLARIRAVLRRYDQAKGAPPEVLRAGPIEFGKRNFTDATARDLVSGVDRSNYLPTGFDLLGFAKQKDGQEIMVRPSLDGQYHLVVTAPPPLGFGSFLPYFFAVAIAIALLGWTLSAGIVSPLHRIANAVDRFGRGDLSARVASDRKDEIGNLARSFNAMADRIQTLLTAERRLLQDVSHELRSPLSRLSLAFELMKDASDSEAAVSRVRREINRLSQLVATLLEVNRSESDPSSMRTQPVPVASLTEEIVEDSGGEAEVAIYASRLRYIVPPLSK